MPVQFCCAHAQEPKEGRELIQLKVLAPSRPVASAAAERMRMDYRLHAVLRSGCPHITSLPHSRVLKSGQMPYVLRLAAPKAFLCGQ